MTLPRRDAPHTTLLFVCLGNICRSPTAEAIMRRLVADADLADRILIDSAGTGDWHIGAPPDKRSAAVGKRRGIELSGQARQVCADDFETYDYILAMDASNFENLRALAPSPAHDRIQLLRDFDPDGPRGASVPDPYFGGADGFDQVFDICEAACRGLLAHILEQRGYGTTASSARS